MIRVKATNEGLIGHLTSSGYRIDRYVPFVALPSVRAMMARLAVRVTNPANALSLIALVLDVGPWNVHDDAYVYSPDYSVRPAAERGESVSGAGTNNAGIDLGEYVWNFLQMKGNTDVLWGRID